MAQKTLEVKHFLKKTNSPIKKTHHFKHYAYNHTVENALPRYIRRNILSYIDGLTATETQVLKAFWWLFSKYEDVYVSQSNLPYMIMKYLHKCGENTRFIARETVCRIVAKFVKSGILAKVNRGIDSCVYMLNEFFRLEDTKKILGAFFPVILSLSLYAENSLYYSEKEKCHTIYQRYIYIKLNIDERKKNSSMYRRNNYSLKKEEEHLQICLKNQKEGKKILEELRRNEELDKYNAVYNTPPVRTCNSKGSNLNNFPKKGEVDASSTRTCTPPMRKEYMFTVEDIPKDKLDKINERVKSGEYTERDKQKIIKNLLLGMKLKAEEQERNEQGRI